MSDYDRIARAIDFIEASAKTQPSLAEIAAHVHLSPYHFQRLFGRWAGITPKRFLQAVTLERAKLLLDGSDDSALTVADSLGLSSSSRLHDHFVRLEAVTPNEYRQGGAGLTIHYGRADSPFGEVVLARTGRGICGLSFLDSDEELYVSSLRSQWHQAKFVRDDAEAARQSARVFDIGRRAETPISLLVRGSNFQLAVWRALLSIPAGTLTSYSTLAGMAGRPGAARAAGSAAGANPVAFLIPCHRVIRQSGALGGYRWGLTRKIALLAWEQARA